MIHMLGKQCPCCGEVGVFVARYRWQTKSRVACVYCRAKGPLRRNRKRAGELIPRMKQRKPMPFNSQV